MNMRSPGVWIALAFVAVGILTVALGFGLGGSPETARREDRDQQRSQQLSNAGYAVESFYTRNNRLPNQAEYEDAYRSSYPGSSGTYYGSRSGTTILPNLPPEYRSVSTTSYELCTTFETSNMRNGSSVRPAYVTGTNLYPESEYPDYYGHPEGRTCYGRRLSTFTIDEGRRLAPPPMAPAIPPSPIYAPNPENGFLQTAP